MLKVYQGPRILNDCTAFEADDDVIIMDEWFLHNGEDPVKTIIDKSTTPRSITSEHYAGIDCTYSHILNPASVFFYHEVVEFSKITQEPVLYNTEYCFSFMLNRKRLPRLMLIRMIEFLDFQNYNYSLCFSNTEFNAQQILPQLEQADIPNKQHFKNILLGTTQLSPRIWLNGAPTKNSTVDNFDYGDRNSDTYYNTMQYLFNDSAVAVIVETVGTEPATVFTEKSLMPVLSLNFPIWFGGWNQASAFRDLGFDVFDDIIDHSYEKKHNYLERCFYSLKNNQKLLTDITYAQSIRSEMLDRLYKNKEYALSYELRERLHSKLSQSSVDVVDWFENNFVFNGYYWT